jgi:predicted short-subunit dehydrogenase-like oxidoreductase (DUF2520 family)
MQSLSIIGAGKAGSTIARLFHDKKLLKIHQILNSSLISSQRAAKFIGEGQPVEHATELTPANFWLIGTSDQQIDSVVKILAERKLLGMGDIAFHLSGMTTSQVLSPLKADGALIASIHPVFSFADPLIAVSKYSGAYCGMEGDITAVERLSKLFSSIGSITFSIDPEKKSLYHAANVFSANYLVTLLNTAERICVEAGLDSETAQNLCCALATQVIENVQRIGPRGALTGPLKRGDITTVEKHCAALKELDPEFEKLYSILATLTKRDLL